MRIVMPFRILTWLIGAALLIAAIVTWLTGQYGRLPALVALGGCGWLLAAFVPEYRNKK